MIGICVLTIAIALGSLGIANSINNLQNFLIYKDLKKEYNEMKQNNIVPSRPGYYPNRYR